MPPSKAVVELQQLYEGLLGKVQSQDARIHSLEYRLALLEGLNYGTTPVTMTTTTRYTEGQCPVKGITVMGVDGEYNCPDGCEVKGKKECPLHE